jgi:hypothetical protein
MTNVPRSSVMALCVVPDTTRNFPVSSPPLFALKSNQRRIVQ